MHEQRPHVLYLLPFRPICSTCTWSVHWSKTIGSVAMFCISEQALLKPFWNFEFLSPDAPPLLNMCYEWRGAHENFNPMVTLPSRWQQKNKTMSKIDVNAESVSRIASIFYAKFVFSMEIALTAFRFTKTQWSNSKRSISSIISAPEPWDTFDRIVSVYRVLLTSRDEKTSNCPN